MDLQNTHPDTISEIDRIQAALADLCNACPESLNGCVDAFRKGCFPSHRKEEP